MAVFIFILYNNLDKLSFDNTIVVYLPGFIICLKLVDTPVD